MIQKGKSTLLQCFPKNSFAADVARSKCLHATSSNAPFCTQYVDEVIIVTFHYAQWENVNVMLESKHTTCSLRTSAQGRSNCDCPISKDVLALRIGDQVKLSRNE